MVQIDVPRAQPQIDIGDFGNERIFQVISSLFIVFLATFWLKADIPIQELHLFADFMGMWEAQSFSLKVDCLPVSTLLCHFPLSRKSQSQVSLIAGSLLYPPFFILFKVFSPSIRTLWQLPKYPGSSKARIFGDFGKWPGWYNHRRKYESNDKV